MAVIVRRMAALPEAGQRVRVQQTASSDAIGAVAASVPTLPVQRLQEVRGVRFAAGVETVVPHSLPSPARVWLIAAARGASYPQPTLVRSERGRLTLVSATDGDVDLWVG